MREANMREANMHEANMRGANLHGAYLREANLREANMREANMREANMHEANMHEANMRGANLHGADLCEADLCEADLCGADLCGANLHGADLCGANLHGANLRRADLCGAKSAYIACPTDGSFIGWKKASGHIVKLQIPEDARRSSAGGEKCRCDKAFVIEIQNLDGTSAGIEMVCSDHDEKFVYAVGATVKVSDFDGDRWNECAPGIHFFIDRRAAVEY